VEKISSKFGEEVCQKFGATEKGLMPLVFILNVLGFNRWELVSSDAIYGKSDWGYFSERPLWFKRRSP
jgi:hypothetical protein